MAKFDEGFYNDGTALAPTLESTAGTPTCADGAIELDAGDGVRSVADDWDLEDSRIPIQIATPSDIDAFFLALDIGGTQRPTLQKHWSGWRAGNINGAIDGGNYGNFAGSGAQKPYAQMRHSGDTIFWETSDDGVTWDTPFYSTDTYGDVSSCQAYLFKEGSGAVEILEVGAPPTDEPALAITTQPSETASGYVMDPAPVVQMTTDGETVDTSFTGNITAELIGAGGVLLGTLTEAAVLGVSTFDALRPCQAGTFMLRFSAAGVDDLDSNNFTVTSGTGVTILGGDMPKFEMRRNEGTASLRRIHFDIVDDGGNAWDGDVDGVKARLSRNGVFVSESPADIVQDEDGSFYVELAQPFTDVAEGTGIVARVPADSGRRAAKGYAQIIPNDSYVPGPDQQFALVRAIIRAANGLDGFKQQLLQELQQVEVTVPGEGPETAPAVIVGTPVVTSIGE